jgi:(p)ppGpp synthase/HD superfamily hydrolase
MGQFGLDLQPCGVSVTDPIDTLAIPTFLRGLPQAMKAFRFAARAHRRQRRESDAAKFIVHPLEVAALLHNTGHEDSVVAAGILHDTVENSDTTAAAIRAEFGEAIAAIVEAMTEDPAIEDYERRKAALRAQIAGLGGEARFVYAADKVTSVRELRCRAARDPDVLDPSNERSQARIQHYLASLSMLEEIASAHPLVRQLRFELELLRALPPRPELLG